ncbi:hypothetical protein WA026_017146 [Henosepilachna vigintioctopunctata]
MFYLLAMTQICLSFHGIFACPLATLNHGGVFFFIPYTIFTFILGYPVHFLECSLGQYSQLGPMRVWDCVPLARGVGVASIFVSVVVAFYNNIYATYAVMYLARCFDVVLPWTDCDVPFYKNKSCIPRMGSADPEHYTPAQHYFYDHILRTDFTEIIGHYVDGYVVWQQVLILFYVWFLIYLTMFQSIKSLERMIPYLVGIALFCLLVLLSASIQIHGSFYALKMFFATSNFRHICQMSTWHIAAQLVLIELGIAQGTLIAYGSYAHHRNKIQLTSKRIICFNYFISVGSCFIVWFLMGSLYAEKKESDSHSVQFHDFGYVFVLFTETLGTIPGARIWCICVFLLVVVSCLNSQIAIVHTLSCTFFDYFPHWEELKHILCLTLCFVFACVGISLCTTSSWILLQLFYEYPNSLARIPISAFTVGFIILIYGMNKYCEDIHFIIDYYPSLVLRLLFYSAPFLMLGLSMTYWFLYSPFSQTNLVLFKILFCLILISKLFGFAYWMVISIKNQNFKNCWRSVDTWGPGNEKARIARTYFSSDSRVSFSTPWNNPKS